MSFEHPEESPGPLLADLIANLAIARKLHPANRHPGVLWLELPPDYMIAVNGHPEDETANSPNLVEVVLPPYTMGVWFRGWLVAEIRPYMEGRFVHERIGFLGAGEAASEPALRAALEQAIKEAGG